MWAGVTAVILCGSLCGCAAMRASSFVSAVPESGPIGMHTASTLTDQQIGQRLTFLTERLEHGRRHASLWQSGWFAVNGAGTIVSGVQAGFEDGNEQLYDIMEAGKAAAGVAYLLIDPMQGRHGAAPIRGLPDATHAERVARLAHAEAVLHAAAVRSRQRTSWAFHLGNLGFNLISGAVLLAVDEPTLAALSVGIDTVVGEAQIWTQPSAPLEDWQDYRRLVATGQAGMSSPPVSWHVIPTGHGVTVAVDF